MDVLTQTEAARRVRRSPETIRRLAAAGRLEVAEGDDGRRGITYASLARYAAAEQVAGFFLADGVLADDAADDIAPAFWAIMAATLSRAAVLRQVRADAAALAAAGRIGDARMAEDWAALAEYAVVVPPTVAGGPWRVRLPAAGLVVPVSEELLGEVQAATTAPVRPSRPAVERAR